MDTQSHQVTIISIDGSAAYQPLLEAGNQTLRMNAGKVVLATGQDCGQHSTGVCEEMLVFLAGRGILVLGDGRSLEVGQGTVAYIGPRTVHNVVNQGREPLVYVYCVSPALP